MPRHPWFRKFGKGKPDKDRDEAYDKIAGALPEETVTDEYGTRLSWHPEIEKIYKSMPSDSARLHPGEPKWQIMLAPKYIHNKMALARFLALVRETEAGDAYLYYPINSKEPVVWYHMRRFTIEEFERRYGHEDG